MNTCICMTESLCCPPETHNTVTQLCVYAQSLQLCSTLCDPMTVAVNLLYSNIKQKVLKISSSRNAALKNKMLRIP